MNEQTCLFDFASHLARQRGLASTTAKQNIYVINSFQKYLARPAVVADLTAKNINGWLVWLGTKMTTRVTQRGKITVLRNAAIDAGLLSPEREKIDRLRFVPPQTQCWSWSTNDSDLRVLLLHIDRLAGHTMDGVPRRLFWKAFVLVALDIGLRLGDLIRIGSNNVGPDGTVVLVQNKTRNFHAPQLSDRSLQALSAGGLRSREKFFSSYSPGQIGGRFSKIVKDAGLKGSAKWCRRTGSTIVEHDNPGQAWRYLGHTKPGLDRTNYIDWSKLRSKSPRPQFELA